MKKRPRKLDALHVRLDPEHERKLSAIIDKLEAVVGAISPSQAVRYAIGKAHEQMGQGNG